MKKTGVIIPFKKPLPKVTVIVPYDATPKERKRLIFEALGALSTEEGAELRQGKPPAPSIRRFRK